MGGDMRINNDGKLRGKIVGLSVQSGAQESRWLQISAWIEAPSAAHLAMA